MGQFEQHLLEVNGETGRPYWLWRLDGVDFEITDLDLAQRAISLSGREVVMGALDRGHHQGIVRVRPELDKEAERTLGSLGIGESPTVPTLR